MIFSPNKAGICALMLLLSLTAQADEARMQAFQAIDSKASVSDLTRATAALEALFNRNPNDRAAKMFYGYGQLFMASDFLAKKNYLRAAELSKLGFFYIDEAAESEPDDWRMRFLRARMDAFVPAINGRCVIAVKDTGYLLENKANQVPKSLTPFITLMSARALHTCGQKTNADAAMQALHAFGDEGRELAAWQTRKGAPARTAAEMNDVIKPLAEVAP